MPSPPTSTPWVPLWPLSTPIPNPGYGTVLPASPVDGQEYVLVDSATNPSYQWRFRYNAGSVSAYKWEFIGGAPAVVEILTSGTRAVATYGDLTGGGVGPSFTLPYAGDWHVRVVATVIGYCYLSAELPGLAASDVWAGRWYGDAPPHDGTLHGWKKHLAVAAGAVTMKYRSQDATARTYTNRRLEVMPARVG